MRIAIQGGRSSFHELAARTYFNDHSLDLLLCDSFRELCTKLAKGKVERAVMAIENTVAGSILPNYSLLEEHSFSILGEVYLRIKHNLMALPGQGLSSISNVWSHPMALMQCSGFLERHTQLRAVETNDTADSARRIQQEGLTGVAAIAGREAAERYGLEIISKNIENLRQNYTRFLILSRQPDPYMISQNKASISFQVDHTPGSLVNVLEIFRSLRINLNKIQSIPILGKPQEYAFHVDLEWESRDGFESALNAAGHACHGLRILGYYNKGTLPDEDSSS